MRACGGAAASIISAATRAATSNRWSGSSNPGRTPAEEMLEKFNGAWGGSVEPAYRGIRVLSLSEVASLLGRSSAVQVDGAQMAARIHKRSGRDDDLSVIRGLKARIRKQLRMGIVRLLRACVVTLAFLAAAVSARPALAQANFDRPGGDYLSAPVTSGDPADCALVCERDRRCRAWTFSYPTDLRQPRGVLAQEQRAGAGAEQLLRLRRARRRRGRAPQRDESKPRSTASAATTRISISRAATATTPARPPAPPTTNAAPGPMPGRAMPARRRIAS